MSLRTAVLGAFAGLAALSLAGPANALDIRDYTPETFAAAQAEGAQAIVFVYADWCPVCNAQLDVIQQNLAPDPRFDAVQIFMIDYDTEKAYMRMVRVAERSTLIAYDGTEEIGRLYNLTAVEDLQAFFLTLVE